MDFIIIDLLETENINSIRNCTISLRLEGNNTNLIKDWTSKSWNGKKKDDISIISQNDFSKNVIFRKGSNNILFGLIETMPITIEVDFNEYSSKVDMIFSRYMSDDEMLVCRGIIRQTKIKNILEEL